MTGRLASKHTSSSRHNMLECEARTMMVGFVYIKEDPEMLNNLDVLTSGRCLKELGQWHLRNVQSWTQLRLDS